VIHSCLRVSHVPYTRLVCSSFLTPAEDPRYGDLGQAFPPWPRPAGDAILQPPKPEIRPFQQVLERAADRDPDSEAGD